MKVYFPLFLPVAPYPYMQHPLRRPYPHEFAYDCIFRHMIPMVCSPSSLKMTWGMMFDLGLQTPVVLTEVGFWLLPPFSFSLLASCCSPSCSWGLFLPNISAFLVFLSPSLIHYILDFCLQKNSSCKHLSSHSSYKESATFFHSSVKPFVMLIWLISWNFCSASLLGLKILPNSFLFQSLSLDLICLSFCWAGTF